MSLVVEFLSDSVEFKVSTFASCSQLSLDFLAPQDCAVCGLLALYHCKDCLTITVETDCSGNFCADCQKRIHSHVKRTNHKFAPIAVPRSIRASYANKHVEHREMELFAVICIQTSHYVTFAKCEEPGGEVKWCFFDSMADRIGKDMVRSIL